jgi:NitT/TauT family transport system permease protein
VKSQGRILRWLIARRSTWEAISFFALIGVIWELSVRWFDIKSYLLPALSNVIVAFWKGHALLLENGLVTLEEVVIGFVGAALGGVLFAVLIFLVPLARSTVYPLIVALQGIPKVALAPLIIVWFGYGLSSKVIMSFLFAFFPIVISTLGGMYSVPSHLEEHFRALRANHWQTFWRLQVPASLPNFIDGCKVAMPLAVIGAVVGEFVGSSDGLGNLILLATGSSRTALTFATLIAVTALSLALYVCVEVIGRLVWWRAK